jgi:Spy/CpxP family protein refolding chaperone
MAEGTRVNASRTRSWVVAASALVAIALAGGAMAQPGPMRHHHGGGVEGAEMLSRLIAHAKDKLNLNTSQQTQFDAAAAQSKAAHETARNNMQRAKDALAAELTKAEPDLAAVAAVADDARAQNQALHKQVRDQWLALYNTFSPDQKAVVKQMIQTRLARGEKFREKMREHRLERQGNG